MNPPQTKVVAAPAPLPRITREPRSARRARRALRARPPRLLRREENPRPPRRVRRMQEIRKALETAVEESGKPNRIIADDYDEASKTGIIPASFNERDRRIVQYLRGEIEKSEI